MSLMNFDRIKINKGIPWQTLDGSVVILSPKTRRAYELNAIGSVVWQALASENSSDTLLDEVLGMYDVPLETLRNDIDFFLEKMIKEGLLETSTNE